MLTINPYFRSFAFLEILKVFIALFLSLITIDGDMVIYVIIRDYSGRYVWKMSLNMNESLLTEEYIPQRKSSSS